MSNGIFAYRKHFRGNDYLNDNVMEILEILYAFEEEKDDENFLNNFKECKTVND